MTDPSRPRLLSIPDTAKKYGLTVWTVRELIWRGELDVVCFPGGRKQWIDKVDMEALIQRSKRKVD